MCLARLTIVPRRTGDTLRSIERLTYITLRATTGTPNNVQWDRTLHGVTKAIATAALSSMLHGILTILAIASFYILACKPGSSRSSAIWQLGMILVLVASTTAFVVLVFLDQIVAALAESQVPLSVYTPLSNTLRKRACVETAALTINVLLGDAVVWWRAYARWPGNWAVRCTGIALLAATFALGTADTCQTCKGPFGGASVVPVGALYSGSTFGLATSVLSLITNLTATVFVLIKAWMLRKVLRQHFQTGCRRTLTEQVFVFLIESGLVYCALWAVIVAWQITMLSPPTTIANGGSSSVNNLSVASDGALVPIIAIYPTLVIMLVALNKNKSQIEPGLTPDSSVSSCGTRLPISFPLRPVSIAVNVDVISDRLPNTPISASKRDVKGRSLPRLADNRFYF